MTFPCGWCGTRFPSFQDVCLHADSCPKLKERMAGLGLDLVAKVHAGGMKLEVAEAIQAKRPKLNLGEE